MHAECTKSRQPSPRTERSRAGDSAHGRNSYRRRVDERRIRGRILREIVARKLRVLRVDFGLAHEREVFADALIGLGDELLGSLTKDREHRELMIRELTVIALRRGLKGRLAIARRARGHVDLRELVVQTERLDDVARLP